MKNKIALLIAFVFSLFSEPTDLLFHLHDAGETYAWLPVIQKLEIDYLVLTTGVSEKLLSQIPKERLRKMEDLESIEPKKVIVGVASELQGKTLDHFKSQGVPTFAYWDNFNADGESLYFQIAKSVQRRADVLLLPSESLEPAFPFRATLVVGHPTLDPKPRKKIALWVGGYGADYEAAYRLFLEGMKKVEGVAVLTLPHPKTGLKSDLTFQEALPIADLVICHQSTAAFQALGAQVPVLHVIPEGQSFDSLPLQKGLAKKVSRVEDFPQAIQEALSMDLRDFYELMGIPENGTKACLKVVLENLQ